MDVDFFRLLTRSTKISRPTTGQLPSAGSQTLEDNSESKPQAKRKRETEQDETSKSRPDPEECRRLLKKNKIKITILSTDESRKGFDAARTVGQENEKASGLDIEPLMDMASLHQYGLSRRIAENLTTESYKTPTEIQMAALPILMNRSQSATVDLLAVAPTGSGKTLAFLIPLLNSLMTRSSRSDLQGIILAPTRELADQIVNEGKKLSRGTGLKISLMKKGMRFHEDLVHDKDSDFLVKANIIVTTPLLFLHAISADDHKLGLPSVKYLVLDEADVLLDDLFRDQTLAIWQACTNPDLQATLWSATMGSSIEVLARQKILERRSEMPSANYKLVRLVVGLKDSAIPKIAQHLTYCASEKGKLMALRQILCPSPGAATGGVVALQPPFLIFTQTITRAIALHSELLYDIPAVAGGSSRIAVLHSDLSDTSRADVMAKFRRAEIWVLITTDLLSRGVDFRGINGVVNYDIPNTSASYVHRIGRTGRQGREGGVAITLYTKEDIPYVKNVANIMAASRASSQSEQQQWLLDLLPKISKSTKKALKHHGVQARLDRPLGSDARDLKKMRISTKSGYDRRQENNRKAAIQASRRRKREALAESCEVDKASDAESWDGFG